MTTFTTVRIKSQNDKLTLCTCHHYIKNIRKMTPNNGTHNTFCMVLSTATCPCDYGINFFPPVKPILIRVVVTLPIIIQYCTKFKTLQRVISIINQAGPSGSSSSWLLTPLCLPAKWNFYHICTCYNNEENFIVFTYFVIFM